MNNSNAHWSTGTPAASNSYPLGKALLVAGVILVITAVVATSFPTYGVGQTTFDPDGIRNLGSFLKASATWLLGLSLACASILVGVVEKFRRRSSKSA